jgi:hypothetical protein
MEGAGACVMDVHLNVYMYTCAEAHSRVCRMIGLYRLSKRKRVVLHTAILMVNHHGLDFPKGYLAGVRHIERLLTVRQMGLGVVWRTSRKGH